jgi:nifR3 family TIM-barrel protein
MISARAFVEGHRKTRSMLDGIAGETAVTVQFMGSDPAVLAEAASRAEDLGADGVDVNMGCAAKKIVKNGAGAALMRDPVLVGDIVRRVRRAVRVPVSVKIRAGWDDENRNALEIGRVARESGVDVLAVHGRTAAQAYRGKADRGVVRALVEGLGIPVYGNGDVRGWEDACRMVEETGCAGVMIGRAALGNPWIFREIHRRRGREEWSRPGPRERLEGARRHFDLAVSLKGRNGLFEMRKQLAFYLKGFPGAREVRDRINRTEDMEAVLLELDRLAEAAGTTAPAPS